MITAERITVGTTPTLIIAPTHGAMNFPVEVVIVNPGTVDVFIGGPSVTITAGLLLAGSGTFSIVLYHGDDLYGIVESMPQEVHVLRTRA